MKRPVLKASESLWTSILTFSLDCIKFKLMDKEEGEGWSRDQVDMVESQYRRFLYLSITHSEPIVPTAEIDKFWHAHILDTAKYAEDCQTLFGFFLHHFPYFGMRGDEDAAALQSSFEHTKRLWFDSFGEPLVSVTEQLTCNT